MNTIITSTLVVNETEDSSKYTDSMQVRVFRDIEREKEEDKWCKFEATEAITG